MARQLHPDAVTGVLEDAVVVGSEPVIVNARRDMAMQQQILDNSPDGVLLCDEHGKIVLANTRLEELLGFPPGSLVGEMLERLVPTAQRDSHARHRERYQDAPRVRMMAPTMELSARHADGRDIPVEIALAPLDFEGVGMTMATVRDARERMRHQRQLQAAQQRLVLAEERERIARDLHDVVIQRLFATGLSIQAVALRSGDTFRERLDEAVDSIDEAIRDIRSSIFQLSRPGPGPEGVRAGVFDLAAEAERLLGFAPRVHFSGAIDTQLDGELGAEVLSVLRELVSNAIRHAQATQLHIQLDVQHGEVRCCVTDNGIGPQAADGPRAGRGLMNLTERAQRRGGAFELTAASDGGSQASWTASLA